ncbi:ExbD/TolR family protein [Neisseria sp. Ec49-e6-T10]|uniref:ExbD/TolR family protein n=1 Tax=Neisseria sp. Ec49-e6-T10 TaxID=3140744 RepID=UPI003EBE4AD3
MAFGNFNQDENQPMAEINTTPLVDVMLVLLVVFMVTMPLITHSIPLNLPESSNKIDITEQKEPMRVSIDEKGDFFIGDKQISENELKTTFQNAFKTDKDTIVAIAADKQVEYKYVAKMLSLAQEAGLKKVGFVTEAQ